MLEVIYVVLGCLGASEAVLTIKKRSNKDTRKSGKDRLTLASLWIVVSISIFLSILFREMIGPNVPITVVTVGGLLMGVSGSLLRWTAIRQLKEAFTVDVSIVSGHNLKKDGVYKYIRHPSYTGLLMNYVGIGIAMNNLYSFAVLSVPLTIAVLYRISIEEKLLTSEFGEEYDAFKSSTKRLIPFIY